MANGPRYAVKFRRRRNKKTNYIKRFNLLKSQKPRLVVRKSNKYFTSQIIIYQRNGDKTSLFCSSRELEKYGWKKNFKNRPAAYLTGYLTAKKASSMKIKEIIPDLGRYNLTKGNKIYAFMKGISDFGFFSFNFDEKVFPSEDIIFKVNGQDLLKEVESVKSNIDGAKNG